MRGSDANVRAFVASENRAAAAQNHASGLARSQAEASWAARGESVQARAAAERQRCVL